MFLFSFMHNTASFLEVPGEDGRGGYLLDDFILKCQEKLNPFATYSIYNRHRLVPGAANRTESG